MSEKIESSDKKPWLNLSKNNLESIGNALGRIANAESGRSCTGPRPITNQPGTPDLIDGLAELWASTGTLSTVGEKAGSISMKMVSGEPLKDWELKLIDELRELGQSYTQEEKGPES